MAPSDRKSWIQASPLQPVANWSPETVSYSRFTASTDDIDRPQDNFPSPQPRRQSTTCIASSMAYRLLLLYLSSNEDRDLDTAIRLSTYAIFLPSSAQTGGGLAVIDAFFVLSVCLYYRMEKHGDKHPSDSKYSIQYLRYIHYHHDLSLETLGFTRTDITIALLRALGVRAVYELGNVMQDIEEMSLLCHELLSSDRTVPGLFVVVQRLAIAVLSCMSMRPQPSHVIESISKAHALFPKSTTIFFAHCACKAHRFTETYSLDDYNDAMATFDKFIASRPYADIPGKHLEPALDMAASTAEYRFRIYGNPEYLEEAIVRRRDHLASTSPGSFRRDAIIQSLARLERTRSNSFGVANGPQRAHPNIPKVLHLPPLQSPHPAISEHRAGPNSTKYLLDKFQTRFHEIEEIEATGSMYLLTEKADVEDAAKYYMYTLASLQQSPDPESTLTSMGIISSADFLLHAYKLTNNPEYLNQSITAYRSILKEPRAQWYHPSVMIRLTRSLHSRFSMSTDRKDIDEMMQLFPIAATHLLLPIPDRFEVSCRWARSARDFQDSSTFTAYKNSISLMQDLLTFAPTLEMQHFRLVSMRNHIETLPLDYASYQIHIGQVNDAIETLERGRGLLWSEMRGFRTSIDHLRVVDLILAETFAGVNRDLEALTTSNPADVMMDNREVNGDEGKGEFGRIAKKQRELLDKRNILISEIRSLPGFEDFLMSPSFNTLSAVAARGPVIVINHSVWRSDIIILLHDSPPSLITTSDDFFDRAKGLKDQLLAARKEGLDSTEYQDALTSVLETLYDLVGKPVIKRLQELNVPEQSRIWWCPTSVFCSLPLHAMGPIRSDGPRKLYFSDLYIPSYTPTLSALIESRKHNSHSLEKPSILLVAQPDDSMPGARVEISHIRHLDTTVTALISKKATPSAVIRHLKDHRFAHFSCHGILEPGKPFDASFKLYQDQHLTLLEVIRSELPSAEFAFLSACHTAELTEESIADEGLHLSAAVQYSGFRSVVGTMWAMADIDGQVLAKHFYASVFSERWEGVPHYERTAEALRDAVQELRRRKKVTTERWVNFVHYGA